MSANTTQNRDGSVWRARFYSEGAVLSPSADSDEAGHRFRFDAGHAAFASADRGDDVAPRRIAAGS
jgi:hypothetical protein